MDLKSVKYIDLIKNVAMENYNTDVNNPVYRGN